MGNSQSPAFSELTETTSRYAACILYVDIASAHIHGVIIEYLCFMNSFKLPKGNNAKPRPGSKHEISVFVHVAAYGCCREGKNKECPRDIKTCIEVRSRKVLLQRVRHASGMGYGSRQRTELGTI